MKKIFGAIEAGGTKFVVAAGTGPDDLIAREVIDTTAPRETLARVIDFFRRVSAGAEICAVGIGSFGPIDIARGTITTTPKPGWTDTGIAGFIKSGLAVPVGFDTDVNAAALGEMEWGAARGISEFIYLTVGTGIGGGAVVNGSLLHGLSHPEMGHVIVTRQQSRLQEQAGFDGVCPYHRNCLEGLASGPAIEAAWGQKAETLPAGHPAWEIEADYLAHALACYIFTLSPKKIIMGGGVMKTEGLMALVRKKTLKLLNGYLKLPAIEDQIESFITAPGLGDNSGVLGALVLARIAAAGAGVKIQAAP
jgi:fructokinase